MRARTTGAASRSKPSYHAVSAKGRTTDPDMARFMAKRMKARTMRRGQVRQNAVFELWSCDGVRSGKMPFLNFLSERLSR